MYMYICMYVYMYSVDREARALSVPDGRHLLPQLEHAPECATHPECQLVNSLSSVSTRNVQWFRGGLVFEAHRLLYHSA